MGTDFFGVGLYTLENILLAEANGKPLIASKKRTILLKQKDRSWYTGNVLEV